MATAGRYEFPMVIHAKHSEQGPELVNALQCYPLQAEYPLSWEQNEVWCLRGGSCRQAGQARALQRQAQGTAGPRKEGRLMATAEWCPGARSSVPGKGAERPGT